MTENAAQSPRPPLSMWVGGGISLVVAVVAIVAMWNTALPVTPPETICPAIYPPAVGCAGDARLLPAGAWSALMIVVAGLSWLLSRRGWLGAIMGVLASGVIGILGYWATLYVRVFLLG